MNPNKKSDLFICKNCGVIDAAPLSDIGCPNTEDSHHEWREHQDYGRGQKSPLPDAEKSAIVQSRNNHNQKKACMTHMFQDTPYQDDCDACKRANYLLKPNMSLDVLQARIHNQNKRMGWWDNPREKGTLLMLVVSELAEAMEGYRKNLMDDHLPHRLMAEVELADAIIRILDMAAAEGYDIIGAIVEKVEYNRTRADHQPGARAGTYGKKF